VTRPEKIRRDTRDTGDEKRVKEEEEEEEVRAGINTDEHG
jgi:hypothetical protein